MSKIYTVYFRNHSPIQVEVEQYDRPSEAVIAGRPQMRLGENYFDAQSVIAFTDTSIKPEETDATE